MGPGRGTGPLLPICAVILVGSAAVGGAEAVFDLTAIPLKTYDYYRHLVQCPSMGYTQYPFSRYPYHFLDYAYYTGTAEIRECTAVILENEYVRVTILPELGGRILRFINKTTGNNEFYDNPAGVKPAQFGYLGPPPEGRPPWWPATGGTEFIFPVDEHGYVFYRPFRFEPPEDLGDRVMFHEWYEEEIAGTPRWRVDIRIELADASASYTVTHTCTNASTKRQELQYWSNTMASPGPGNITVSPAVRNMNMQLILPPNVDYVLDHNGWNNFIGGNPNPGDGWKQVGWPYHTDGMTVNLSRVREWWNRGLNLGGLFSPPGYDVSFQGIYNLDANEGLVRVFPARIVPGVDSGAKFFLYSHSTNDYWSQYTDQSTGEITTYIEMMGGPNRIFYYPTNAARPEDPRLFFDAGRSFGWVDRYYAPHRIGTVAVATHRAALNFEVPSTGTVGESLTVRLGVFPVTHQTGGRLLVNLAGVVAFDSGLLDISPGNVPGPFFTSTTFVVPSVPAGEQSIRMVYRYPDHTEDQVSRSISILGGLEPTETPSSTPLTPPPSRTPTATPTPAPTKSPSPSPIPTVTPTWAPPGTQLLRNPGFEEDGRDFALPPIHWGYRGTDPDPMNDADGTLRLGSWPQFTTPPRTGVFCAGKYTEWGVHRGYFYQVVSVRPGRKYECISYGYTPGSGGSPGKVRVGVDLTGAADPAAPSVLWTDYASPFGKYTLVGFHGATAVTATGGTLTFYFELRQPISTTKNALLVDDASVIEVTEVVPTDTPTPWPHPTMTPAVTPTVTPTPGIDTDADGLPDLVEGGRYPPQGKTHAFLPDSDGDGLLDGREDGNHDGVRQPETESDPRSFDTDGDGYEDGVEVLYLGTSPLDPASPATPCVDSDGDCLPADLDADDLVADRDGDRFVDGYEAAVLDLPAPADPARYPRLGDVDGSGVVDDGDAQMVLDFFASREAPGMAPAFADLDRNGLVDNLDAQFVIAFAAQERQTLPFRRTVTSATEPGTEEAVLELVICDSTGNPLDRVAADTDDPAIGGADFVVELRTSRADGLAAYSQRIHFDSRVTPYRDGTARAVLPAGTGLRQGIVAVNLLRARQGSHSSLDVSAAGIKGYSGPQALVWLGFDVLVGPATAVVTLADGPDSSGPYSDSSGLWLPHTLFGPPHFFETLGAGTTSSTILLR